jgi:tRNA dimethylallyltransferase
LIICIIGPTCSGKSKLAEVISQFFEAPIINFDAFQVYKEMNIGTAKPSKEELLSGRYFLYDFRDIDEPYDVAQYQSDARKMIEKFKGRNLIFVGGTGLYLKAVLYDYKFEKEDPMPKDYLCQKTNEELFKELIEIDPIDANKIGINNRKRLIRALFVYNTHKESKSEINQNGKDNLLYKDVHFIGLDIARDVLYKNINLRVDAMINNGLEEEANALFIKYGKENRALQAIGYKEFNNELEDQMRIDLIKQNTRNYAKRQMTFFRHQFNDVHWFNSLEEATQYAKNLK